MPFQRAIIPECDSSLRQLEKAGYTVNRVEGYSAIDQARCQLASDSYFSGYKETLWIDSDICFQTEDVEKLRAYDEPITCGIYPQKGKRALACHVLPGTEHIEFGTSGGLIEIKYAGAGFLHVRRCVYEAIAAKLPICNEEFDKPMIPFFMPLHVKTPNGHWYLAEDFAFCHRARECGFRIMADTTIRLWHLGEQNHSWDALEQNPQRTAAYRLNLAARFNSGS